MLREALAAEPSNVAAKQLQVKVLELEAHLRNFENARAKKNWAVARLALDKCFEAIEGEAGEAPTQWRCWRIEMDLARNNLDAANTAAKYVRYSFTCAASDGSIAMLYDWTRILQMSLPYVVSSCSCLLNFLELYSMLCQRFV